MSTVNFMSFVPTDHFPETTSYGQHPFSMDVLDELSWPCQFMPSPDLVPSEYTTMPSSFPTSPASLNLASSHSHSMTDPHQRRNPQPRSHPCPSVSRGSASVSQSPTSPHQGFASVLQQPLKQDRERRKAQNRASQRAYRERKEVQLKDLAASLKKTERAMSEARQERKQLEDELASTRTELDVIRKENEVLRWTDARALPDGTPPAPLPEERDGSRSPARPFPGKDWQGVPKPDLTDEGYDGGLWSSTASLVGTPKEPELVMEPFDWDGALLCAKDVPGREPDVVGMEIIL